MTEQLTYVVRSPETVVPEKKYPAIFLMHGMGSNEQDLIPLVEGLSNELFIFSLRGPLSQGPGYAFFSIEGYGKPHREVFDAAIGKIEDFMEYAKEKYPIDKEALFLMGFSQGAILSMSLGLKVGNNIKGLAALSGYIPAFVKEEYANQSLDGVQAFISHGEQDPALPFAWGEEARNFYSEHGATTEFKAYPAGHTVTMQNYEDLRAWFSKLL